MHGTELGPTCPKEANVTVPSEWPWLAWNELWNVDWPLIRQNYAHYYHLVSIFASMLTQNIGEIFSILSQDEIFVYGLQLCLLLLFLYLMHLLRPGSSETMIDTSPTTTPNITKELSCDFNFVSEQEKKAALEAAMEAMLEVEEKRRRKRFTKKRKCVSAGPILIALRHHSQRPKRNRNSALFFEPMSPREQILENTLVLREKPLTLSLPPTIVEQQPIKTIVMDVVAAEVDHHEVEDLVALMCVGSV